MSENAVTAKGKQSPTAVNAWVDSMIIEDYQNYPDVPSPSAMILQCGHEAMAAVQSIFEKTPELWNYFNANSKLRRTTIDSVKRAAILGLSTTNKECYFATRYKGPEAVMEMNIYGDGYRKLLKLYGDNVDTVYPEWIICEGDEFIPPRYIGIEIQPPSWNPKYESEKCTHVVLPVKFKDGHVEYSIVGRNDIKKNIYASAKQKMMFIKNDTLKKQVFDALNACESVDDMLACEVARPYINAVYFDYPEEMIRRKMINKAIRKFKLVLNPVASRAFQQSEPEYANTQAEITENENATPLVIDGNTVDASTGEVVKEQEVVVESNE